MHSKSGYSTQPKAPNSKNTLVLLSLGIIVFLTRLLFLNAGYGLDSDAWRVAEAARRIATTGEYSVSRFPGYPLQELCYALFWKAGPLAFNGVTALFSALATVFFALSMKQLGSKNYIIGSLALAFVPVVYLNSTNSMDYLWAFSFIMASYYCVLKRRVLLGGVILGLAIGCRISSGAMLFPLSLLIAKNEAVNHKITHIGKFALATLVVAIAGFLPVLMKYGAGFLTLYAPLYPSLPIVVYRASIEVWGIIGLLALVSGLFASLLLQKIPKRESAIPKTGTRFHVLIWILVICLYIICYLRLPQESGYLIPAVPFIILLLARILDRRVFIFFCIAILFSPFFLGISLSYKHGDPKFSHLSLRFNFHSRQLVLDVLKGPLLIDHSKRIEQIKFMESILAHSESLNEKAVIVCGEWLPKIRVELLAEPQSTQSLVKYVYLLDQAELHQYLDQGFLIYYLPGQRQFNLKLYGIDLLEKGAKPFIIE